MAKYDPLSEDQAWTAELPLAAPDPIPYRWALISALALDAVAIGITIDEAVRWHGKPPWYLFAGGGAAAVLGAIGGGITGGFMEGTPYSHRIPVAKRLARIAGILGFLAFLAVVIASGHGSALNDAG
jgi:hypothetical protein